MADLLTGTQLDLFAAMQRRERGQRRALDNAQAAYREALWQAIEALAASGAEFTADDVRARAGDPPSGYSPNVLGAVVQAALKRGLVEAIGITRSARVVGHGNKVCVLRGRAA